MPILHNGRPNPQAMMLGNRHLRKVMLGGDVVWSKDGIPKPIHDLTLESLEYDKVKLTARNRNTALLYPKFFPDYYIDAWLYMDRLTYVGRAVVSLQTIDAMLVADVVENDMHFPKFFFNEEPAEGKFDYRRNLTFIANESED